MERRPIWALAALALGFLLPPALPALETGDLAPPFVNPDLHNRYVSSKDALGKRWLILDFFATDCEACKKELPVLERLRSELAPDQLCILVFATDPEGPTPVGAFFRSRPTPLTVLLDRYRVTAKKYGVNEIPSLFLVDRSGRILYKQVGWTEDLYERIRTLLFD